MIMESKEKPMFNSEVVDDADGLIAEPRVKEDRMSSVSPSKGLISCDDEGVKGLGQGLRVIVICTATFAIIITIALIISIYLFPEQDDAREKRRVEWISDLEENRIPPFRQEFRRNGIKVSGSAAVVTKSSECSRVGLGMIRQGGNAVDAAVAAAFCLAVIHPQSSGIGGGGFLLYHDHKSDLSVAYDFRETAPASASETMLDNVPDLITSGLSVGVPGELKGLWEVHSEWGLLSWEQVLQPAIDLAREGFNVSLHLANDLRSHVDAAKLNPFDHFLHTFAPRDTLVKQGDVMKRSNLAATLELIKDDGPDAFYNGPLGERFVDMVQRNGGLMQLQDLASYVVQRKDPVVSDFKGTRVISMPAPSSGPAVVLMLNMLEGFNWTLANASQSNLYQQMVETFKFGFGQRGRLGDPSDPVNSDVILNASSEMLSKDLARSLRMKVDNESHDLGYYAPVVSVTSDRGTTHISVIDPSEVMVSLTLTLNYWFGSRMMTEDGIIANNEMLDFSFGQSADPSQNERNRIKPGLRPMSSMSPTVVSSVQHPCAKRMVIGASNGTRIVTGIVEMLANIYLLDMDLKEALDRPRLHQQLHPSETYYEDILLSEGRKGRVQLPDAIRSHLSTQKWLASPEGLSCVEAIVKVKDDIQAEADWRCGGSAAIF